MICTHTALGKALLQQIQIASVKPPGSYELQYIQKFLVGEEMEYGALSGKDADLWGSVQAPEEHDLDLLCLLPRHNENFFSRWVTETFFNKLLQLRHYWSPAGDTEPTNSSPLPSNAARKRKTKDNKKISRLDDHFLLRCTFGLVGMLASALPILAIAMFYFVHPLKARFGLIAVFNLLLSFSLAAFKSAKRAEVFSVTAAFSDVQVVFVQLGTTDIQTARA